MRLIKTDESALKGREREKEIETEREREGGRERKGENIAEERDGERKSGTVEEEAAFGM